MPAKVDNVGRAILALGGRRALIDTLNDVGTTQHTKRRLSFRFRPEDVHAHPAWGRVRNLCSCFVIGQSKRCKVCIANQRFRTLAWGDPVDGEHAIVAIQKLRRKSNPAETKIVMKIVGSASR